MADVKVLVTLRTPSGTLSEVSEALPASATIRDAIEVPHAPLSTSSDCEGTCDPVLDRHFRSAPALTLLRLPCPLHHALVVTSLAAEGGRG